MSVKNSNDNIGNRTHDLPSCSAVPQPTATQRAPSVPVQVYYSVTELPSARARARVCVCVCVCVCMYVCMYVCTVT